MVEIKKEQMLKNVDKALSLLTRFKEAITTEDEKVFDELLEEAKSLTEDDNWNVWEETNGFKSLKGVFDDSFVQDTFDTLKTKLQQDLAKVNIKKCENIREAVKQCDKAVKEIIDNRFGF